MPSMPRTTPTAGTSAAQPAIGCLAGALLSAATVAGVVLVALPATGLAVRLVAAAALIALAVPLGVRFAAALIPQGDRR